MNLHNVKLILVREIRDQLRDRRTMFMIFVLPLLLYPLLGMSLFQVMQFRRARATDVLVAGMPRLLSPPYLIRNGEFNADLRSKDDRDQVLLVPREAAGGPAAGTPRRRPAARWRRASTTLALYFPADFAARLEAFRQAVMRAGGRQGQGGTAGAAADAAPQVPSPQIIYTTANERSQMRTIASWPRAGALGGGGGQEQPGRRRRARRRRAAVRAGKQGRGRGHRLPRGGAVVENPAGDAADLGHDRGLLSGRGPLRRREGTRHAGNAAEQPGRAQRNRPGQTADRHGLQHRHGGAEPGEHGHGGVVDLLGRSPEFGPPPPLAPLWLAIALVPISALYQRLCLALAAFARSTREGQYYLIPCSW